MAVNIDIRPSGIESGVTSGVNFSEALKELKSRKIKQKVIPFEQNAQLRIQEGREAYISQNGNYVREGCIYYQGEAGILVPNSPFLTNSKMLQCAIEENRQGRYFSTPNKRLYEKFSQQAQQDASKAPKERRAVFMPSDNTFEVSQKQNSEIFELLGLSQAYLDFVKQDSLSFFPVGQKTLEGYFGTVPTQLWFGWLVGGSVLCGNDHGLDLVGRVRGVRQLDSSHISANASQKNSQPRSELYDSGKIRQALVELGFSGLEAQLFKSLRTN